jgi:hypothetical protein
LFDSTRFRSPNSSEQIEQKVRRPVSAIEALAAAKTAGVLLTLDGDGIVLETKKPPLPADVVAMLKAAKPDLLRILEWREAAMAALEAKEPEGCGTGPPGAYGIRRPRWDVATGGLRRFLAQGWADQACLMGWTKEELYRVPALWSQISLTGAALLIGEAKVIAVTEDNIVIETQAGSRLKFRRIGREHVA